MESTKIEWTDATVNFWSGCKKVSDGCKFCYMYRAKERYGKNPKEVVRASNYSFEEPLRWREPKRIFTCSNSDFFISDADEWRSDAWDTIRMTPEHTWQILTKRPERIIECLPRDWGDGWPNVWLGVSIESQKYFQRADILRQVPCQTRLISAEPLLGELDVMEKINGYQPIKDFHWIIIGGESGNKSGMYTYRPCEQQWIERIIEDVQMYAPAVAVFMKQTGTWLAKKLKLRDNYFGGNINEWPCSLQIREYPEDKMREMESYS